MRIPIAILAASLLSAATAAVLHAPLSAQPEAEPATEAEPGLVWRNGTATLRLTDRPCPFNDLRLELEREGVPPVRAYDVQQGGKQFTGCWSSDMGGDVMTLEPGRELGQIPVSWFRAARGA